MGAAPTPGSGIFIDAYVLWIAAGGISAIGTAFGWWASALWGAYQESQKASLALTNSFFIDQDKRRDLWDKQADTIKALSDRTTDLTRIIEQLRQDVLRLSAELLAAVRAIK